MIRTILVYGATGYSGRLIAAEGKVSRMSDADAGDCQMILASRGGAKLREVARLNRMHFRAFDLNDVREVAKHLTGINVVINAAGPFSLTAEVLAKAALNVGCHYVDINGEVDVYRKLDDLGRDARQRNIAIASSVGYTAAASDLLLDWALTELARRPEGRPELGAVRIAMSSVDRFSRGSAQTLARSLREQVVVVRKAPPRGQAPERMVVWHEPVGKLERIFDFGPASADAEGRRNRGRQIASVVNLVDTLTARLTVSRHEMLPNTIESYMRMGAPGRIAYQVAGAFAALNSVPWIGALTREQLSLLSHEPGEKELERERNLILLEIEDRYQTPLIDWLWETPNVYQFTAQLAVAAARNIALKGKAGWQTPAEALGFSLKDVQTEPGLRGAELSRRLGQWPNSG